MGLNWSAGLEAASEGIGNWMQYELDRRAQAAQMAYQNALLEIKESELDWTKKNAAEQAARRRHEFDQSQELARDQMKSSEAIALAERDAARAWRELKLSSDNTQARNKLKIEILGNKQESLSALRESYGYLSLKGNPEQQAAMERQVASQYDGLLNIMATTEPGEPLQVTDEAIKLLTPVQKEAFNVMIQQGRTRIDAYGLALNTTFIPDSGGGKASANSNPGAGQGGGAPDASGQGGGASPEGGSGFQDYVESTPSGRLAQFAEAHGFPRQIEGDSERSNPSTQYPFIPESVGDKAELANIAQEAAQSLGDPKAMARIKNQLAAQGINSPKQLKAQGRGLPDDLMQALLSLFNP